MYQIDVDTVATSQPASTSLGTVGYFTDGNASTGVSATVLPAEFMNALMLEILNTVTGAGLTASKTTYNQLYTAVKTISQAGASNYGSDTGAANAYAVTYSPTVSAPSDGMTRAFKVKTANTGASTFALDGSTTTYPIYGLAGTALKGGELTANGVAMLRYNSTLAGWVLLYCSGGALQIAAATASNHAVQLGQVSGVAGSVRNFAITITAASASASATADEIIVETALGGLRYCLPSFSKTITLTSTGAGGMDTGSAPASGYVAIYAIYNPTTGVSALLGTNATSAKATTVYSGSNMPSGYTASGLVSVLPTTSASIFKIATQRDRMVQIAPVNAVNATTFPTTATALSISGVVPLNAVTAGGYSGGGTATTAGVYGIYCSSDAIGTGFQASTGYTAAGGAWSANWSVFLATAQTIYYYSSAASGATFNITISQYTF